MVRGGTGDAALVELAGGDAKGLVTGVAVESGVGAGVVVGAVVGAVVGSGVGRGVGAFVGAAVEAATTITMPRIVSKWTSQKYGYVPAVGNAAVNVDPSRRNPADAGRSSNRLSMAPGLPLVTVCGSPLAIQET